MKKIIITSISCLLSLLAIFAQTKTAKEQKIALLSDVSLVASWGDSIKVDSLYAFQLVGHKGKISNIKIKLAYGSLQQTSENNYKLKINPNDKTMDLSFTKLDPISKENKVLKQIVLPAKK